MTNRHRRSQLMLILVAVGTMFIISCVGNGRFQDVSEPTKDIQNVPDENSVDHSTSEVPSDSVQTDPTSTDDSDSDAVGDVIVDTSVECVSGSESELSSSLDEVVFAAEFVGEDHTSRVVLTNRTGKLVRVTSIKLKSGDFFKLHNVPSVPLQMIPCASLDIDVEMLETELRVAHQTRIIIEYEIGGNDSLTKEIVVKGTISYPEDYSCDLITVRKVVLLQSLNMVDSTMSVGNRGTSECVIESLGIADCSVDDQGVVRCPSPAEAEQSPAFSVSGSVMMDGTNIPFGPGHRHLYKVNQAEGHVEPATLPRYAMVFMKAREKLTGRRADYPQPEMLDDGTVNYGWQVVLKP